MAAAATSTPTMEELLAEDGVDRWLIRGQLREQRGTESMTVRNRLHSRVMARLTKFLDNWLDQQPQPRGSVLCGEAGVRLRRDPETIVGVDVVYISAELVAEESDETTLIDGVPLLAVEIISPNDRQEDIEEKIDEYLDAGVSLVWVINPYRRTVLICKPGTEPELVNALQELRADPQLPGFRVSVAELFV